VSINLNLKDNEMARILSPRQKRIALLLKHEGRMPLKESEASNNQLVWLIERVDLPELCYFAPGRHSTKGSAIVSGETFKNYVYQEYSCPKNWTTNLAHALPMTSCYWETITSANTTFEVAERDLRYARYSIRDSSWLTRLEESAQDYPCSHEQSYYKPKRRM
jgi:hypothetical protein